MISTILNICEYCYLVARPGNAAFFFVSALLLPFVFGAMVRGSGIFFGIAPHHKILGTGKFLRYEQIAGSKNWTQFTKIISKKLRRGEGKKQEKKERQERKERRGTLEDRKGLIIFVTRLLFSVRPSTRLLFLNQAPFFSSTAAGRSVFGG